MLNEISISQLKYISDNLDKCSNLIKSAVNSRIESDVTSGNNALVIERDTQKKSPSDYYKLRFLMSEICLFYDGSRYFVTFSNLKLDDLQSFFSFLKKNYYLTSYDFYQIVFDKFGSYALPLIPGEFNDYVLTWARFCMRYIEYILDKTEVLF